MSECKEKKYEFEVSVSVHEKGSYGGGDKVIKFKLEEMIPSDRKPVQYAANRVNEEFKRQSELFKLERVEKVNDKISENQVNDKY